MIGLLARAPGIDRRLLDRLAGPGFVERALAAGVPLRRQLTGGLDLAAAASFRSAPVEPMAAAHLAAELVERDRPIEAIGLLLDAGAPRRGRAHGHGASASRSPTPSSRGSCSACSPDWAPSPSASRRCCCCGPPRLASIGRVDDAVADIDRAVALAADAAIRALRRRVEVEAARARLAEGRREDAVRAAEQALVDLGDGEEHTYARAYEVLAECAATSDARPDLQRAAECYRVAAAAWEGCGEYARARACRRDLAMGVLVPLGRYDEALAQLGQLLATADLSDAERSWTVLFEGFVLLNANRLESADARFVRVADIGYVHDNPRLIAAAAWGRALVAARRGDLDDTLRWIATAENTALTDADDVLGVPFLCDVATALGALGELELADAVPRPRARAPVGLPRPGGVDGVRARSPPGRAGRRRRRAASHAAGRVVAGQAASPPTPPPAAATSTGRSACSPSPNGSSSPSGSATPPRSAKGGPTASCRRCSSGPRQPARATSATLRGAGDGRGAPAARHRGRDGRRRGRSRPRSRRATRSASSACVVANGGSATFDQLSEAIWPGEEVETSRTRLRNVLLRLRRAVGDVVVRSGTGVRLAATWSATCSSSSGWPPTRWRRRVPTPSSPAESPPRRSGPATGTVFVDFEYEEWAIAARRAAEQQLIGLLDLLSVQAEDAGDLPAAQALAERALRLDRYTDSRYVRLAELLTLQDRVAAAIAVLDDAAEVAERSAAALPASATRRRDDLVAADGVRAVETRPPIDLEEPRARPPEARRDTATTGRAFATGCAIRRKTQGRVERVS